MPSQRPAEHRELTVDLARLVLEELAEDELPELDDVADEYFENPDEALAISRRDEALGSGINLAMMAPYVLAVSGPVVQYLLTMLADGVQEAGTQAIADRVSRFLRRRSRDELADEAGDGAGEEVSLDNEELDAVRREAFTQARLLGYDDQQAETLAYAMIGRLAARTGDRAPTARP